MSDKKLLVLVTRMKGSDEWEDVWGFPTEHLLASIRHDKVTTFGTNDISNHDVSKELDADVWVIHGQSYRGKTAELIGATLNKIDWKQQKAVTRIHFGLMDHEEFQVAIDALPHEHTKEFFKAAEHYGIGDKPEPRHPLVRFASLLRKPSSKTDYTEALEALMARTSLHTRIANTMHHLSYVLHPLDIDVQGLIATDFTPDYWREVVEDYKDGKALAKLKRTNDLIYATQVGGDDPIESVLAEAERRFGKEGPWTLSWQELAERYLPKNQAPANIKQILTLLQDESEDSLQEFKTHFSKEKNPIHEWITNINRTLSEIRDALSKREKGLNGEKEKELRQAS